METCAALQHAIIIIITCIMFCGLWRKRQPTHKQNMSMLMYSTQPRERTTISITYLYTKVGRNIASQHNNAKAAAIRRASARTLASMSIFASRGTRHARQCATCATCSSRNVRDYIERQITATPARELVSERMSYRHRRRRWCCLCAPPAREHSVIFHWDSISLVFDACKWMRASACVCVDAK